MTIVNGFFRKEQQITSVRVARSSNLSGSYNNGPNNNGVGATLTISASSLTIDGVTMAEGDRILLFGQTSSYQNGIYFVYSIDSSVVLKRAPDFQTFDQMKPGYFIFVAAGTEFNGSAFGLVEPQVQVVGTDGIVFANSASSPESVTLSNLGLKIYNPAGTFLNTLTFDSAITANRTFTITTGDAARTMTLSGNPTLADWFDQSVKSTASPVFTNLDLGSSGVAGSLDIFPSTAANGKLIISALDAGGAFNTTIRNSAMGQSSVVSIPDPGAATANFLLDAGAANILSMQEFVGINEVLSFGTGTWTTTRIAQGNYVKRHTPADETSIIAVDITPQIRTAASKGFRLDSFDYIYGIAANALDAHSAVLDRIAYANNVAVSVTSIPITATLATATQANPYLTNCTVTTPAFDVTADSKYVLEITVDNAAASEYDFYGIMLRFGQTIA